MVKEHQPAQSSGAADVSIMRPRWELPSAADVRIEEVDAQRYGSPSIASGSFGTLTIALYYDNRRKGGGWGYAAVKTIPNAVIRNKGNHDNGSATSGAFLGCKLKSEAYAELATLRVVSGHPCIVPLLAAYCTQQSSGADLALAFPYCPIDLETATELKRSNDNGMISEPIVKAVFQDALSALAHCHEKCGIVHIDVNPSNVLISVEGRAQLTDFGSAVACSESSLPSRALCSISYRAPEILLGFTKQPHGSLDVWSAGLILCELLTLRVMFPELTVDEQLRHIFDVLGTPSATVWPKAASLLSTDFDDDKKSGKFDAREPKAWEEVIPRLCGNEALRDLVQATVALDPLCRCSAKSCLEMPWFSSEPGPAGPQQVLEALVPSELMVVDSPPVVINDDKKMDLDQAKKRAVSIAELRREWAQRAFSEEEREWWLGS